MDLAIELMCSIENCFLLAICSDGKDQWCIDHKPSPKDCEKFDIRPINRIDIPNYPY